ncbi:hypothetical protein K491DRAFT_689957 [Lophiostoma macrostomum CBS 122681]|uniref:Uncharacterized protein n=1 Tax=Lophiostoma macrostomum CBS 122681 TaxID=1314788 RepID=A0A6A6TGU0_9PLEO|nr:hypothetical protein K491DRAFT_689957 [Lophiostoma macrostomum CBS 122681]
MLSTVFSVIGLALATHAANFPYPENSTIVPVKYSGSGCPLVSTDRRTSVVDYMFGTSDTDTGIWNYGLNLPPTLGPAVWSDIDESYRVCSHEWKFVNSDGYRLVVDRNGTEILARYRMKEGMTVTWKVTYTHPDGSEVFVLFDAWYELHPAPHSHQLLVGCCLLLPRKLSRLVVRKMTTLSRSRLRPKLKAPVTGAKFGERTRENSTIGSFRHCRIAGRSVNSVLRCSSRLGALSGFAPILWILQQSPQTKYQLVASWHATNLIVFSSSQEVATATNAC